MTSLTNCVRDTGVRRWTSGIAGATFALTIAGCDGNQGHVADARRPIAITASGIEIMEVVEHENERTVEAVVVAGGEERQVTLAPYLDGPLPSGVSARMSASGGGATIELTYGWDELSGATWVRQQSGDDTLELMRVAAHGRVTEEYTFNDQFLRLEYANLPPAVVDKTTAKYLRGEPLGSASADVVEFASQLQALEGFVSQLPPAFAAAGADGGLLTSLLSDPAFTPSLMGRQYQPNMNIQTLCLRFGQCVALICRIAPYSVICGVCIAGVMACIVMEWFCLMAPGC